MEYKKIYENLIRKAQSMNRKKSKNEYLESHHIIPKCLGGSNESNNIVLLTAREHFIAHRLLCKIEPKNNKLWSAMFIMMYGNKKQTNRKGKINSVTYEMIQKKYVDNMRKKKGFLNSFYGRKHSEETRKRMKESRARLNICGENNPNYGNFWTSEQKEKLSKKMKGKNSGELSSSKRPEVRKKIAAAKLGANNPNAKEWLIRNKKTGEVLKFTGGIKRFLRTDDSEETSQYAKLKRGTHKKWELLCNF